MVYHEFLSNTKREQYKAFGKQCLSMIFIFFFGDLFLKTIFFIGRKMTPEFNF